MTEKGERERPRQNEIEERDTRKLRKKTKKKQKILKREKIYIER